MTVTFSRVQEIDGSYFESFTALAWKQENQRQTVLKAAEVSASDPPPQEGDLGIVPIDYTAPQNEKDKLYVEMLYTIANTVSRRKIQKTAHNHFCTLHTGFSFFFFSKTTI
mgnify:CR=1 FL=1